MLVQSRKERRSLSKWTREQYFAPFLSLLAKSMVTTMAVIGKPVCLIRFRNVSDSGSIMSVAS